MFNFILENYDNTDGKFEVMFKFPSKNRKQKNRRRVKCEIFHNSLLVAVGYSTKCNTDNYVRYEGRKWALTHAIYIRDVNGNDISPFSKEQRKLIWNQFFKQFGRVVYVVRKMKIYG